MPNLSDLTDPAAVAGAIAEFKQFGRDQFLLHYKLDGSRDYFVEFDGELIDSKPIAAVAFGMQHPEHGLLPPAKFSGGVQGAVRALKRLGFEVVTRAQKNPPLLGTSFATRTKIYEAYGGDKVAGIVRFPGDEVVNVFSDEVGPYADDPPTLTEPFGYRGEGLRGHQKLAVGGNALLESSRIMEQPVRFWHRPAKGEFSFRAWTAVIGRVWLPGVGQDGAPRSELEWQLQAVPGPDPVSWPSEVVASHAEAAATIDGDPNPPEAQSHPSYGDLIKRVESRGQARRPSGVLRTDFPRSAAARRAVLVRCGGVCESPFCTGMPAEKTRRGDPILDVDHVKDLALRGEDHPSNMVALCPNCHAAKTRGANARQWRSVLTAVARKAHSTALAG